MAPASEGAFAALDVAQIYACRAEAADASPQPDALSAAVAGGRRTAHDAGRGLGAFDAAKTYARGAAAFVRNVVRTAHAARGDLRSTDRAQIYADRSAAAEISCSTGHGLVAGAEFRSANASIIDPEAIYERRRATSASS